MTRRTRTVFPKHILTIAAVAVLMGCSGSDDAAGSAGQSAAASTAPGAIRSIADAKSGVVFIVATGSFVDAEAGLRLNSAGTGSGFIIDPSGIAVTNNHVVTGAATLEVYVGGSRDPVNARVLGVSECADLAVIDLSGEGYPYFEWYADDIDVNLDVRAAGFPLGDPEYTLTRGIVSKARAGGETNWASVDAVLEHDAHINPGNSGGPLLSADARVVGVNYAGASSTGQFYSIAAPLARRITERLAEGSNVQSLGINGQAFLNSESGLSGIWVASVDSGSAAARAGIQGGDIVTQLEGLALSLDGTMKTYCDVLQTKGSDATLKVQVLRYATQEILEGEINGRALAQSFSFAETLDDRVAQQPSGQVAGYSSYVSISDDSGLLSLDVPAEWADLNGAETEEGYPAVSAAPDLAGYFDTWDVPGVIFIASEDYAGMTDDDILDIHYSDECTSQGPQPYQDNLYSGTFEFFSECGGSGTARVLVVARPADNAFAAVVDIQIVTETDLEALDRIIDSFVVNIGSGGEQEESDRYYAPPTVAPGGGGAKESAN